MRPSRPILSATLSLLAACSMHPPLESTEEPGDGAPQVPIMDPIGEEELDDLASQEGAAGVAAEDLPAAAPRREKNAMQALGYIGGDDLAKLTAPPRADYGAGIVGSSTVTGRWGAPDDGIGSETYTDYGVNEMTAVEADPYSTFSIDVDTASYSIARRKLSEGQLPPTASVRVEEFVNYLRYDYVGPTGEAPFAVNMEGAPHPFQPSHHILRFGIQGREVSAAERRPVHLTFLVDTSGSMSSPDKMGLVKRSLRQLVDQLQAGDTVALATYAGSVRRVLGPTSVGDRTAILSAIEDLSAGGSTAMSSGIDLAYEMADAAFVPGDENRVVVLSDGDANVGPTSHEQILGQIRSYADRGITLSTVGFGMGNYQDTLMEQLADKGDGNYAYIDTFAEAQKVFGEDIAGTLEVIARDVKVQVAFNPQAVIAYRLIGYENRDIADRDFRNDAVDAGEIGAGHQVTALYDVLLRDDYRDRDIAAVRLRGKPPGPDRPAVEWETRLPGRLVRDELAEASDSLRLAFGAASFAELLRGSPYTAEVHYADLLDLLDDTREPGAQEIELRELIAAAGRLSGEDIALAAGR